MGGEDDATLSKREVRSESQLPVAKAGLTGVRQVQLNRTGSHYDWPEPENGKTGLKSYIPLYYFCPPNLMAGS